MKGLFSNYLSAAFNPWRVCIFFCRGAVLSLSGFTSEMISLDLDVFLSQNDQSQDCSLIMNISVKKSFSQVLPKDVMWRSVIVPPMLRAVWRRRVPWPTPGCSPPSRPSLHWQKCRLKCELMPRTRVLSTSLLPFHWASVCPFVGQTTDYFEKERSALGPTKE